ncbi:TMEM175 family protein [Deinococcus sp. AJ005]|uniref:TMEM175 family protein n=1 Tax=Deinococcus sp. AJ005 TaxID=2652443 RepID=UPI00125CCE9D|nr:TMEM175 family protein [Deinococcus sp. AJ005]QFP76448.1 DUF1211 domain-containing protein [Deinococcus sp. AJ005]
MAEPETGVAPTPPGSHEPASHDIPLSRVHGLSDGVFAIVVTLLVLELHIPEIAGTLSSAERAQELNSALVELLPRLLVFFVTFLVAGVSWVSQTRFQARLSRADPRLAFLNIIYLMFVSLLPFTAAVIGLYGDTPTGLATYAVNQALIGLAFLWMLWHAVRHDLMSPGWRAERLGQRALINLSVFALMALAAVTVPSLAFFVPFVLPVAHPLLSRTNGLRW